MIAMADCIREENALKPAEHIYEAAVRHLFPDVDGYIEYATTHLVLFIFKVKDCDDRITQVGAMLGSSHIDLHELDKDETMAICYDVRFKEVDTQYDSCDVVKVGPPPTAVP